MAEIITADYISNALDRETTPFQDDELFEKILTLILTQSIELQDSLVDISKYAGLENATGSSLDLIGELIGQARELPAAAADIGAFTYFGFDGSDSSGTFGDLDLSSAGAVFLDQSQVDGDVISLSDDAYRFFIRAKIIANTTKATPNEIIDTVAFLFAAPSISYSELNASIYLGIGRKLDEGSSSGLDERAIAYLYIPRPAGVALYLSDYDPDDVFGFQGSSDALGFGDLTDSTIGGAFASSF